MKKLYTLLSLLSISLASQGQVVISQVYGGGGNGGATYSNDFIELFNRGSVGQNLSGWTVQYASANGATWASTTLPNFMLMPGKYFLIQEAVGANVALALPTPDLNGIGAVSSPANGLGLAMSGSNGKVILVSSTTLETVADPTGSQIIDKVAYGATPTSGFEGTGPTGTALTSTTAVLRNSNGCADANNNAADFTTAAPAPRNNATATNLCNLSTSQNQIAGLKVFVSNNNLNITSDNNELKSVSLYNVLGKEVIKTSTYGNPINVSELSNGIYIVRVSENGKSNTLKVVIQ
jgi:predicted extracellular nuclease